MPFRFFTPTSDPFTGDIFSAVAGEAKYNFSRTLAVPSATLDRAVFVLTIIEETGQKIYVFSLSDFNNMDGYQGTLKAGWYYFNQEFSSFEPIDFSTEFQNGIVFDEISERSNPEFCETILFETGTSACKLALLNETKLLLRLSLRSIGVDLPETTPFRQYAGKIDDIPLKSWVSRNYDFGSSMTGTGSELQIESGQAIYVQDIDGHEYFFDSGSFTSFGSYSLSMTTNNYGTILNIIRTMGQIEIQIQVIQDDKISEISSWWIKYE